MFYKAKQLFLGFLKIVGSKKIFNKNKKNKHLFHSSTSSAYTSLLLDKYSVGDNNAFPGYV